VEVRFIRPQTELHKDGLRAQSKTL